MSTADLIVVGAGIGGLGVAHFVRRRGLRPLLLDAAERPGGRMRSVIDDGMVIELGPLGWLDREPLGARMAQELGLEVIEAASEQKHRQLLHGGRLHTLPSGPGSLLRTRLLSTRGKVRMLTEPFRRRRAVGDESTMDFARRRFGDEFAEVFLAAMVAGIFGGDPEALSMRSAFPQMVGFEEDGGSIIRGAMRHMRRKRRAERAGLQVPTSGKLLVPAGGMQQLADAVAASLGDDWRPATPVDAARRDGADWVLLAAGREVARARQLVLAVPPRVAADLLVQRPGFDVERLWAAADEVPVSSLAVVAAVFPRAAFREAPRGFGFIALRSESFRPLGVQYPGCIFPSQTPADLVQLRILIGGAFDPEACTLSDAALTAAALDPVRELLGVQGEPQQVHIARHRHGIPQYTQGHSERVAAFAAAERALPGLRFAGDGLHGVGVNAVLRRAEEVARQV